MVVDWLCDRRVEERRRLEDRTRKQAVSRKDNGLFIPANLIAQWIGCVFFKIASTG